MCDRDSLLRKRAWGMEAFAEERPRVYWVVERSLGSLLIFALCYAASCCWRAARANQKLSLGDPADYQSSERRGLLLPVARAGGRGRY